jgi:molybdopterin molybdotransferase
VLEPGVRLDYPQVALLASVGQTHVAAYRRPRVAIVSTGDEVIEAGAVPEPFQIRNSNAYSLAAQVRRQGGEPVILPIAPDRLDRTRELVQEGLKADMLLLSGGASTGKYDFIERVLAELGAEFFFTKVAIQPGKPLVFGHVAGKPVFGLPGNPISTMVTFRVFAAVALDRLAGLHASPLPFVQARLASDFRHKPSLTRFLPAKLRGDYLGVEIHPLQSQGSGDVVALAQADCFLVATTDRESWKSGDLISILPL